MNPIETTPLVLLPPNKEVCQQCAVRHAKELPHNHQSVYWHYWFYAHRNRWPTWEDAMAHCSDDMKQFWIAELRDRGIELEGETSDAT